MRKPVPCRQCETLIPLEEPAWWRFCSPECAAVRPRKVVVIVASVTAERPPRTAVETDRVRGRLPTVCRGCGEPIPGATGLGRPRMFCGKKCSHRWHSRATKQRAKEARRG